MGFTGRIAGLLIAAVVMTVLAVGCASDSNSDASENKPNEIEASNPGEAEPSRAFLPDEKNKIPKFGQEASAEEREAASLVLEENLKAREAGDWAVQCASLTAAAVKEVEEGAAAQGVEKGNCAEELEGRAEPLSRSKSLRANTMTGPIDALRFKGDRAYALYHGAGGADYAMPMEKVGAEWKVGALLTEEP